jgi:hypothetical protein
MAKIDDVLLMLIPQGGWVATGHEYEGIEFKECEPITKEQFEAGFAKVDALKAEREASAAAAKTSAHAKLAALGLTGDELKALGL